MSERAPRVLIVEARFYDDIADELAKGATEVLDRAGVAYDRLAVPGAFEIPAAIRFALAGMEAGTAGDVGYDGFVALGCVIRGETDHYTFISEQTSRALMELTITHAVALGFGLLTCESRDQARVRAAVGEGDKGANAARACLCMMGLKRAFGLSRR